MTSCRFCGDSFKPLTSRHRACSKPECKRAVNTVRMRGKPRTQDLACPTLARILDLYRDGVPTKVIAETVGLKDGAVRNRLSMARKEGLIGKRRGVTRCDRSSPASAWNRLYQELAAVSRAEFLRHRQPETWQRIDAHTWP